MPMETNPRVVFERRFGRPGSTEERVRRMEQNRSILDSVKGDVSSLERGLGARDKVRLDQYLAHVRESRADDLRVSLADKLYNARAMVDDVQRFGDDVWGRFKAGKQDQIWYYRSLVDAYRSRGVRGPMFDEFACVVGVLSRI